MSYRPRGVSSERPSSGSFRCRSFTRSLGVVPDRYRALILTAGLAGLRQGELFALRRSDLDLEDATVSVRRERLRLASGDVIEGDPKSEAGRRTVSLPQLLVAELRVHLLQYAQTGVNDYVFVGPTGQPLERSNFRAGFGFRPLN